jgi:transposase-like protein
METKNNITLPELASYFQNEDAAREFLENLLWPDGPVCPHCGSINEHYRIESKTESKRPSRKGLWACKDCRKQFSVKVGTIFEGSHVPIHIWLYAFHLLSSSKKGMSAHQLHRTLGVTYKTAWFIAHRIRYAMESESMGKMSGIVEADETYVGGKCPRSVQAAHYGKTPVFSLVERDGRVKSQVVERVTSRNLKTIIRENVETTSTIMTDDFSSYKGLNKEFYQHKVIRHSRGVYSRPGGVHTNTIEGYFSILKRGIVGVYQHVGKQHLDRYLAEFDFRYNARKITDGERAILALKGIEGKRLTYKD